MFVSHQSLKYFVENSELRELFSVKHSLLNKSVQAKVDTTPSEPSSEPHTEHIGDLLCKKCC